MILSFHPLWPILLALWVAWLILLPGYLIAYLIGRKQLDFCERVGASFALGFLDFSFLGLIGYLFSQPLSALFWASSLITVLLGLSVLLTRTIRWFQLTAEDEKSDWKIEIVIISVALIGALVSFGVGWYPRGDAAIHLQAICKIIGQSAITQPIYSLNTKPVILDHAYDTYYFLIALITRRSGLELTVVWRYLSGILALMLPFVVLYAAQGIEGQQNAHIQQFVAFPVNQYFLS